jgi:hypothetical protein
MKKIIKICGFFALYLLGFCLAAKAEYKISYLGSIVSDNERIIDASSNGWLILADIDAKDICHIRYNLNTKKSDRLCEKGLASAQAINDKGVVLGKRNKTTAATWSPETGLVTLKKPGFKYNEIRPVDINNNGISTGYTVTLISGDYYAPSENKTLIWDANGKAKTVQIEGQRKVFPVSINDKQKVLLKTSILYLDESFGTEEAYLRSKSGKLTKIEEDKFNVAKYGALSLNNKGQIASANGEANLYTPGSGWRELLSSDAECDRCDAEEFSAISDSGKAIFDNYTTYALSDYPHAAINFTCLAPQNGIIQNTKGRIGDLEVTSIEDPRFLKGDRVIFTADLYGDDKGRQVFILEKNTESDSAIYNFCLNVNYHINESKEFDCEFDYRQGPRVSGCKGDLYLSSIDGAIPPMSLDLIANVDTYSEVCPNNVVQSFEVSGANDHVPFSLRLDPEFYYFVKLSDPRFKLAVNYLAGQQTYMQISPLTCRKPLEGLIGIKDEDL